jgi:hypothetical protein
VACAGTEAGRSKAALLKLLKPGGPLAGAKSVIAYTTFQAQADDAARCLCANGVAAAAYHAGKHAKVRTAAGFPPLRTNAAAGPCELPAHLDIVGWVPQLLS